MPLRRAVVIAVVAACSSEPELDSSVAALVDPNAFVLPTLTAPQREQIVKRYAALDPSALVPRGLLEDAIIFFDVNKAQIPKQAYFVVVDLSRYSGDDRFWLVDLATGHVEPHMVAHGQGSDPNNTGYATTFSNISGSYMSSLGFYLTGEIYDGTHPHSMRIDGLSPDGSPDHMADTNVRSRLIVVHEASYVSDSNTSQQGRSDGCFALDPNIEAGLVDKIHDGSLMYAEIQPLAPPVGADMCGNGTCDSNEDKFTCPEDCGACGTIAATGGIIDNTDACFAASGPSARLHDVATAGYGGSLVWTTASALTAQQNFADWSLDFAEAGRYRVEVYTAAAFAQSTRASYVVHASGADQVVAIDQTAVDGYQSLGDFAFAQGPHQWVHLADDTGETGGPQLVFDAIRVTRDDGTGSGSDGSGKGDGGGSGAHHAGCAAGGGGTGALLALALALVTARRRSPRSRRARS